MQTWICISVLVIVSTLVSWKDRKQHKWSKFGCVSLGRSWQCLVTPPSQSPCDLASVLRCLLTVLVVCGHASGDFTSGVGCPSRPSFPHRVLPPADGGLPPCFPVWLCRYQDIMPWMNVGFVCLSAFLVSRSASHAGHNFAAMIRWMPRHILRHYARQAIQLCFVSSFYGIRFAMERGSLHRPNMLQAFERATRLQWWDSVVLYHHPQMFIQGLIHCFVVLPMIVVLSPHPSLKAVLVFIAFGAVAIFLRSRCESSADYAFTFRLAQWGQTPAAIVGVFAGRFSVLLSDRLQQYSYLLRVSLCLFAGTLCAVMAVSVDLLASVESYYQDSGSITSFSIGLSLVLLMDPPLWRPLAQLSHALACLSLGVLVNHHGFIHIYEMLELKLMVISPWNFATRGVVVHAISLCMAVFQWCLLEAPLAALLSNGRHTASGSRPIGKTQHLH